MCIRLQRLSVLSTNASFALGDPVVCPSGSQCPAFATCCMVSNESRNASNTWKSLFIIFVFLLDRWSLACMVAVHFLTQFAARMRFTVSWKCYYFAAFLYVCISGCPSGNQCDLQQQRCTAASGHSQPLKKRYVWPDDYFVNGKLRSITCGDKQSECPDNTTCCQMPSGDYGCCPFADAVCCS